MRVAGLLSFLLFVIHSAAQSFFGTVTDEAGHGIPFVTVYVYGLAQGDATNEEGQYHISVTALLGEADTLVFSCLGYGEQKVPVRVHGDQRVDMILKDRSFSLATFEVKPDIKAHIIVKRAVRAAKKNYVRVEGSQKGFYREVVYENGAARLLNECALDRWCSAYPQKRLDKQVFNAFWDHFHSVAKFDLPVGYGEFAQHWPLFTTGKDQVNLLATRSSAQAYIAGERVKFGNPFGGPMDLLAMDNLKYQRHFLNPKLFERYAYEHGDKTTINGVVCYAIHFRPKGQILRYHHVWNKKDRAAFYEGVMYISVEDLVVVRAICRSVFDPAVVGYKTNHRYIDQLGYTYTVNYQPTPDGYVLANVTYEAAYNFHDPNNVSIKLRRELYVAPPQANEFDHLSSDEFPWRYMTLRQFNTSYEAQFWEEFEETNLYVSLREQDVTSLTRDLPLSKQYELANLRIEEIKEPVVSRCMQDVFEAGTGAVLDSAQFENALKEEDDYAKLVLAKMGEDERRFTTTALRVLKRDVTATEGTTRKAGEYYTDRDSIGHIVLYQFISDSVSEFRIDLTEERSMLDHARIVNILHNGTSESLLIYTLTDPYHILKTRHARTHELLDSITQVNDVALVNDSLLIYSSMNERGHVDRVWLHRIGQPVSTDKLLFKETDVEFDLELASSASGAYIFVTRDSRESNEVWTFNEKTRDFKQLTEWEQDVKVTPDHFKGNDKIFAHVQSLESSDRIISIDLPSGVAETVYTADKMIEEFYVRGKYLVLSTYWEFSMSLVQVELETGKAKFLRKGEESVYIDLIKPESSEGELQVSAESAIRPWKSFVVDTEKGALEKHDVEELGYWDKSSNLQEKVVYANAVDGERIPVLLVYDKAAIKDSVTALLVQGYGAYGSTPVPLFEREKVAYARCGVVLAFPAIRGSSAKGKQWYYGGKELNKQNTFSDFVQATKHVQEQFNVPPGQTFAKGVSAGGLLMGVMVNTAAELYGGVIMDRSFLNVHASMSDPDRYLTSADYQEWGNPEDSEVSDYLKHYSPIDAFTEKPNLSVFARASYFDQRTAVDESLLFLSKLRCQDESDDLLLLRTRYDAGHEVPYSLKETGEEYGFMMYVIRKHAR